MAEASWNKSKRTHPEHGAGFRGGKKSWPTSGKKKGNKVFNLFTRAEARMLDKRRNFFRLSEAKWEKGVRFGGGGGGSGSGQQETIVFAPLTIGGARLSFGGAKKSTIRPTLAAALFVWYKRKTFNTNKLFVTRLDAAVQVRKRRRKRHQADYACFKITATTTTTTSCTLSNQSESWGKRRREMLEGFQQSELRELERGQSPIGFSVARASPVRLGCSLDTTTTTTDTTTTTTTTSTWITPTEECGSIFLSEPAKCLESGSVVGSTLVALKSQLDLETAPSTVVECEYKKRRVADNGALSKKRVCNCSELDKSSGQLGELTLCCCCCCCRRASWRLSEKGETGANSSMLDRRAQTNYNNIAVCCPNWNQTKHHQTTIKKSEPLIGDWKNNKTKRDQRTSQVAMGKRERKKEGSQLLLGFLLLFLLIMLDSKTISKEATICVGESASNLIWPSFGIRLADALGSELSGGHTRQARLVLPEEVLNIEAKFELWRSLLEDSLGDLLVASGQINSLARKLTNLPDQKRATLFYLDLLAKQRDRLSVANSPTSGHCRRRTNFAELTLDSRAFSSLSVFQLSELAENFFSSSSSSGSGARQKSVAEFQTLAKLSVENANLISRLLIHPESGIIKGIATKNFFNYLLESAIRRHQQQQPQDQPPISADANTYPADSTNSLQQDRPLLHSVGFVFFKQPTRVAKKWKDQAEKEEGEEEEQQQQSVSHAPFDESQEIEFASMALNVASLKRVQLLELSSHQVVGLESKSELNYFHPITGQHFITSWWLDNKKQLGVSRLRKRKQMQALERRLANSLLWQKNSGAREEEEEKDHVVASNSIVSSDFNFTGSQQLKLSDGRWFSPYYDCQLSNRWLMTYSVPFFASSSSSASADKQAENSTATNKTITFRGVAFTSLDFGRMRLIDQCAESEGEVKIGAESKRGSEQQWKRSSRRSQQMMGADHRTERGAQESTTTTEEEKDELTSTEGGASSFSFPSFLSNTHHCARRLKWSKCVRLRDFQEVRSGGYLCHCPLYSTASNKRDRSATSEHRDKLAELLTQQQQRANGSNNSAAFEQLMLELADERWSDKMFLATKLAQQSATPTTTNKENNNIINQSRWFQARTQSLSHFLPGAQLEADAELEWLVMSEQQQQADQEETTWPIQTCQCSSENNPNNEGNKLSNRSCPAHLLADEQMNSNFPDSSIKSHVGWIETLLSLAREASWLRPLIISLQSFCMLLTIALIGLLFRVRKSRSLLKPHSKIIIQSGWLMLETTLIGALILYTSVFVRYFEPTSITCLLEPWFRELGFSIFYGSILIKLYRILTEFQTRKAHRVCFRDKDQIVYLMAIVLIVIGYMSAWTALMVDGFFFSRNQNQQHSSEASGMDFFPAPNLDSSSLTPSSLNDQFNRELQPRNALATPNAAPPASHAHPLGVGSGSSFLLNNSSDHDNSQHNEEMKPDGLGLLSLLDKRETNEERDLNLADDQARKELKMSSMILQAQREGDDHQPTSERIRLLLARNLNSFANLFSALLESEQHYDSKLDHIVYRMRCRKLTWDYVTESSEIGLLMFGVYLVYKLRNADSEVYKEKLVLSFALFIELFISLLTYTIRHSFWQSLTWVQLLILYCLRCQLTVSLTLALVFAPKLWSISKSRPSTFFSLVAATTSTSNNTGNGLTQSAGSSGGGAGGGGGGGGGKLTSANSNSNNSRGTAGAVPAKAGSARHRCHISCELHDHHLNDAMRLHQAMLSNSALDIGSINLADMDPDEIQAELKRVYAQLELMKTKAMRRDNPHISKRRGGRKSNHRKFSLQAFHAKHIAGHHSNNNNNNNSNSNSNSTTQNLPSSEYNTNYSNPSTFTVAESEQSEPRTEARGADKRPDHHHHHHHHGQHPHQLAAHSQDEMIADPGSNYESEHHTIPTRRLNTTAADASCSSSSALVCLLNEEKRESGARMSPSLLTPAININNNTKSTSGQVDDEQDKKRLLDEEQTLSVSAHLEHEQRHLHHNNNHHHHHHHHHHHDQHNNHHHHNQ